MIYALSNAGADPNVTNGKGNTPLHEAIIQHINDNGFDLIQVFYLIKFFNSRFTLNACGAQYFLTRPTRVVTGPVNKFEPAGRHRFLPF
jgi:hypothetical protein